MNSLTIRLSVCYPNSHSRTTGSHVTRHPPMGAPAGGARSTSALPTLQRHHPCRGRQWQNRPGQVAPSLRTIHLPPADLAAQRGRRRQLLLSSGKYDGDLEQLTVAAAGGGRRRGMEQGVEVPLLLLWHCISGEVDEVCMTLGLLFGRNAFVPVISLCS